jgi:hypothetical protein
VLRHRRPVAVANPTACARPDQSGDISRQCTPPDRDTPENRLACV